MLDEANDPVQLLATLRAVRSAQRLRKKQRRREAKQAALDSQRPRTDDLQPGVEVSHDSGTAGLRAEHVEVLAAEPAPVPDCAPSPESPQPAQDATNTNVVRNINVDTNDDFTVASSYLGCDNLDIGNARIAKDFPSNAGPSAS